ncbi:MAG: exodeoxyribonuclease V subunit gamma [Chlamydiota bacterium]
MASEGTPDFFLSNRIEHHYYFLRAALFDAGEQSVFRRRIVVVPSHAMRSWLMLRLAEDADCGIAAGVDFQFIDKALEKIFREYLKQDVKLPSSLDLSLRIEIEIKNLLQGVASLADREREVYRPLIDYLGDGENLSTKRLTLLCEHLAFLFNYYGAYAPEVVAEWENSSQDGWQQELWRRIFGEWDYLPRLLDNANFEGFGNHDVEFHLFGFGFIPSYQHEIFNKLAEHVPVNYYILSPCKQFWSDIRSDREIRSIHRHLDYQGLSEQSIQDFEHYLRDNNPLLANYGRLGREFASILEELPYGTTEIYCLPQEVYEYDQYRDLLYTDLYPEKKKLSLLSAVQTDILLMRNPQDSKPLALATYDETVQIDVCTTKLREIEVLYNNILKRIHQQSQAGNSLYPEDVVVMAANIEEYIPYIKAVFGRENSHLKYNIRNAGKQGHSYLMSSFLNFIDLRHSRWSVTEILDFLDCPAVQKCHHLSPDSLALLRRWLKDINIQWGMDSEHRHQTIAHAYPGKKMLEKSPKATWEFGFQRLIEIMASSIDHRNIDLSTAEVIGKVAMLLRSIYADLQVLKDEEEKSLGEWADYITCLLEAYYYIDEDDKDALADRETLLAALEQLRKASHVFSGESFSFATVWHHFTKILERSSSSTVERTPGAVIFCSMLPMRAVPSRVIGLIGMGEDAFPRKEVKQSMNLVVDDFRAKYFPVRTDFDRYLFLEAILSARDNLLISYINSGSSDGALVQPSAAVEEFVDFCDNSYSLAGKSFSSQAIKNHPHYPFHHTYFDPSTEGYYSYSLPAYLASQTFYHSSKGEEYGCFPEYTSLKDSQVDNDNHLKTEVLDLKNLALMASNPFRAYFNRTLGIYLADDECHDINEEFVVSSLERYLFKKEVFNTSPTEMLEIIERQGLLPLGALKDVASRQLLEDARNVQENVSHMGVSAENTWEIELDLDCCSPRQVSSNKWLMPAISLETSSRAVTLVGVIENLVPQGLLTLGKDCATDAIKIWPLYLALASLEEAPCSSNLLMVKSGKMKKNLFEDPRSLLAQYVEYYFVGLENCSPLLPGWVPNIINDSPEELKQNFAKKLFNRHLVKYNGYLHKACPNPELIDATVLSTLWQPWAEKVYGEMLQKWYPKTMRKR